MSQLAPCPTCARHVKKNEQACPFCSAVLSLEKIVNRSAPAQRLGRAATFAFGAAVVTSLAACSGPTAPTDAGSGTDSGGAGDASGTVDSGGGTDSGGAVDAGSANDAAAAVDAAGAGNDSGAEDAGFFPPYGAPPIDDAGGGPAPGYGAPP